MLLQLLANGLHTGSITALVGIGFLLVYRTCGFFHFAHGIVLTAGAYFAFLLIGSHLSPPIIAMFAAVLFAFMFGLLMDGFAYRPLRKNHASDTALFIASMGIYSAVQNVISLVFGDDTLSFRWWTIGPGRSFLGFRLTVVQIVSIICSWTVLALTWMFLQYSPKGKRIKAVSNDPELAWISGIEVRRIYLWVIGLGSALGGIAGILTACDVDMTPTMGMQPLMMGMVAVIVGGSTIWGTACGALLLGMATHVGVIIIPTKWQDAITFFILLLFLIFRPQGFSGKNRRKRIA